MLYVLYLRYLIPVDLASVALFVTAFLLWHLGVREPFTLTLLAILIGAIPAYILQLRKPRPAESAVRNRQKVGRPEENTHPGLR